MKLAIDEGHIYQLGRHRLMCGNSTNPRHTAMLFGVDEPSLVVTSPPYADCRDYDRPIACWDSLMLGAFDGHRLSADVQMLINLGPIHRKGEWVPYWHDWLNTMQRRSWRIYSQYIWDKKDPSPGCFKGRLCPQHEYIFHLNKEPVRAFRAVKSKLSRKSINRVGVRNKAGIFQPRENVSNNPYRVAGSVIQCGRVYFGEATGHPAQMPERLVCMLIRNWAQSPCLVYDPFCGSGTTIMGAQRCGVSAVGMEIAPRYVAIAIDRWNKKFPNLPARRV